jgi:Lrp/AsnC family transcriptional regulator for asnA, asnC and gidA
LQITHHETRDSVAECSQNNGISWSALAFATVRDQDERVAQRHDGSPPHLDDVSKGIIEQLQKDGRMPYAAIGKAVGLSEAAVRQRVQRLLDSGVMQIVAVTDPLQLGFARQAMIGIHAEGDLEPIADELSRMPEVDYVIVTAGSFDLIVEVVCESDDHLLELLSKRIRSLAGIRGTESFVYLKLHKQTYSWGVR